ncbi:hypothetical protein PIB30_046443 [Stylosanthes scabra]|uniref:Zinc knuckle CX2CX4HX4C domain-containing protein n=1 Tax=Stylosanthes scabra TaxID=79078 RepID=A0ABU6YF85_9FABA|nr:hypothetical protein [Stylosanthes scabra]
MSEREGWPLDRSEDSDDGGEDVILVEDDISKSFRVCAKSLIGRIFADRIFSIGTMESAMGAIWSKPGGFRVADLEIGRKLARRIGEVMEVDLFEVKGKESRILKVKIDLNGLKRVKDSLKLSGPNLGQMEIGLRYERLGIICLYCAGLGHISRNCQTLLEDCQQNRVRQEALGE